MATRDQQRAAELRREEMRRQQQERARQEAKRIHDENVALAVQARILLGR